MANYLTVIHECKDYPTWKQAYDADAAKRAAAGLTEFHVLREHDNANLVALMFGVDDVGRAKAFVTSPDLAAAMKTAGIVGSPKVRFRHGKYHRVSAPISATMTLTVRDYETAIKAYAMDAADRKGAGLTDLAVLQLDDDPNNLLILWAVSDVARATAFFDSPALAAHMAKNAGVVGPPERHFWKA
ncbi:MAG: hypothetical protein M3N50_03295 [Pseudomonadota bacterium]|nr:hypothetical protein [Pseudomonadota bacterium]